MACFVARSAVIHLYWLEQIMFRARHAVKFAARGLCLKCNVRKSAGVAGNREGNDAETAKYVETWQETKQK
jgi:hypothetical protein